MSEEQTEATQEPRRVETICARELHTRTGATLQDVALNGVHYIITLHGRMIAAIVPLPNGIEGYLIGHAIEMGLIEIGDDNGEVAEGKTATELLETLRLREQNT